ncbi:MAG: hypothetical protein IPM17_00445 [Verrucomicrobia bacterium]|nr:hypothetical protein [Verrucomicrobiota bacterium]
MNKLFDYLACARPVLLVAKAPYDPVAAAQAGLSVPPGDPVALVQAVQRLAAMPAAERWQMGLNGRRHAERHHDFNMLAERFEGVLHRAVTAGSTSFPLNL